MIFINEWLPNPDGADTKAEFVELFNNSSAPVALHGWTLRTSGKKILPLGGYTIEGNGYLTLKRSETKITLKNSGESVALYDISGKLVDQSSFLGQAPSGQSFSRIYYPADAGGQKIQPESFAWGTPTPGAANKINLHNSISVNNYPFDVPVNAHAPGAAGALGMTIAVGAFLAALMVYFVRHDEEISKLIFPGNAGVGG